MQFALAFGVFLGECVDTCRVADHRHAVGFHARFAYLFRLPIGHRDDAIDVAKVEAVAAFVHADFEILPRPATRYRNDRDSYTARRNPTEHVRLVGMRKQDVGFHRQQLRCHVVDRGTNMGRVVRDCCGFKTGVAYGVQKRLASPAFGERQERRLERHRQVFSQPEHLPFGTAEKGTRRQVYDPHEPGKSIRNS